VFIWRKISSIKRVGTHAIHGPIMCYIISKKSTMVSKKNHWHNNRIYWQPAKIVSRLTYFNHHIHQIMKTSKGRRRPIGIHKIRHFFSGSMIINANAQCILQCELLPQFAQRRIRELLLLGDDHTHARTSDAALINLNETHTLLCHFQVRSYPSLFSRCR
jgi:hypothetical protein